MEFIQLYVKQFHFSPSNSSCDGKLPRSSCALLFVSALLEPLSASGGKTEKAGFDQSWEWKKQIKVSISAWGFIWIVFTSVVLNLWFSDPWRAVSDGCEWTQNTPVPIVGELEIILRSSNGVWEQSSLNRGVQTKTLWTQWRLTGFGPSPCNKRCSLS